MKRHFGFTLVEIAIVLVIIGLLLGGILKGQELINNARVRNVADQQTAIKAAYFAFQDRFRALPGDYAEANLNIPNVVAGSIGNGDAQITGNEPVLAWHHLTNAGFLSCAQCAGTPVAPGTASAANSPVNAYGGVMSLVFDSNYSVPGGSTATSINNLKSGNQVPSNILAEVDRKIDDGNPATGAFRYSGYTAGGGVPPVGANCAAATGTGAAGWVITGPSGPGANCGAANLF